MSHLQNSWPPGLSRRTLPFVILAMAAMLAVVIPFDETLSRGAQALPEAGRMAFLSITNYGLSDWVLLPTLTLAILLGIAAAVTRAEPMKEALGEGAQILAFIFVCVGFPGLFTAIVKRLLGRGRPENLDAVGALGFQHFVNDHSFQSFPSGHTTTSFALAYAVGFLWPRAFWPLLVVAVLVGISRVVIGVHFPSDVLAGAVVGTVLAFAVRNVFAGRGWLFGREADGAIRRRPLVGLAALFQSRSR
ncbi:MAG: phosphatase PAP2 family protein [Devosia sp.]